MRSVLGISGWEWVAHNHSVIVSRLLEHIWLTVSSVAIGFAISLPLGILAARHRAAYPPVTWVTGLIYTIPSIALYVLLLPITGLSHTTAVIALTLYTLLILIRNVVAGLNGVPEDVKEAARGMGYTLGQLLWRIELPLAVPAIMAGIRVATVSTIGLVTIAALIGRGGLGQFILDGLNRFFYFEIVVGATLSVALALVADALLVFANRTLTPWARPRGRAVAEPKKAI
jgi:osmoprotectant transport system permease protein